MASPRKPPYRRKNLADISYTDRFIANFVQNFVAMATGVGRRKMRLASFNGPSPKPPYMCKNLAKICYASQVIVNFVQISLPWQRGRSGENAIGSIRSRQLLDVGYI